MIPVRKPLTYNWVLDYFIPRVSRNRAHWYKWCIFHLVEFRKLPEVNRKLTGSLPEGLLALFCFPVVPEAPGRFPEGLPEAYRGAVVLWGSRKVPGRFPEDNRKQNHHSMSLNNSCKQPDLGLSAEERSRCFHLWGILENELIQTVCSSAFLWIWVLHVSHMMYCPPHAGARLGPLSVTVSELGALVVSAQPTP